MNPLWGVYTAVVVATADPQNRGRVRLQVPQVAGLGVTGWAEPVAIGTVATGDQVRVWFEGGDRSYPVYLPLPARAAQGWAPIQLASGWIPGPSPEGNPVARITADGMLEMDGSAQLTSAPTQNSNLNLGTLPTGMRPKATSLMLSATDVPGAASAELLAGGVVQTATTTSTAYTSTPSGLSGVIYASFIASGAGQAVVTLGALTYSSAAGQSTYLSMQLTQGSTVISTPSDSQAAITTGTDHQTVLVQIPVTNLTPGVLYTATAQYRSGTSTATATWTNHYIRVDPVAPLSVPAARLRVQPDGTMQVLFPLGSVSERVSLVGFRTQAA